MPSSKDRTTLLKNKKNQTKITSLQNARNTHVFTINERPTGFYKHVRVFDVLTHRNANKTIFVVKT